MKKFGLNNLIMLFLAWSLLLLSGCTSNSSKCPSVVDSPKPENITSLCYQTKYLSIGNNCHVLIEADNYATNLGLVVKKYQQYQVLVPDNQIWYDCTRRNTPLCGEDGSFFMNLLAFKKKHKKALWFSVIAEVKSTENVSAYDLCEIASKPYKSAKLDITYDGMLLIYPNDAVNFYDNNRGKIWLEIQRLK